MEIQEKKQEEKVSCADKNCPLHGKIKLRGRSFKGKVVGKFPRRICIEFDRTIYIKKYERHAKKKTKIHARLPDCMKDEINLGDYVKIMECRPLSKIIHFVVAEKIKKSQEKK